METVGLTGPELSIYWTVISLVLAGIWVFSTWFYESRLFSTAAFVSLSLAFYCLGEIFDTVLPAAAYEVRLGPGDGSLQWIERTASGESRFDTEPGSGGLRRAAVGILSVLPIDWML